MACESNGANARETAAKASERVEVAKVFEFIGLKLGSKGLVDLYRL